MQLQIQNSASVSRPALACSCSGCTPPGRTRAIPRSARGYSTSTAHIRSTTAWPRCSSNFFLHPRLGQLSPAQDSLLSRAQSVVAKSTASRASTGRCVWGVGVANITTNNTNTNDPHAEPNTNSFSLSHIWVEPHLASVVAARKERGTLGPIPHRARRAR